MEDIKKNEMNMIEGNFFKKIFIFALPLMFSGVLQLFYNAADLIVCGRFGTPHAVGAISATNSLINLIIQLFLGMSVGTNVMMARCYGSYNKEKGQRVAHTSMLFGMIFGVVVGVFGAIFSRFFLVWMATPSELIDLSTEYLEIYFLGLPFSMIYNFGAALLRATGDSRRPFYFLMLAGLINVLMNLLFVIVFKLDVVGVALATIISQGISAILVVICLCRNKGFLTFSLRELKIHKEEALEIVKIGLPAGLQGTIFSLSNVLIQSSINDLGANVVDGNGAAVSLEGFVYTCMNSVAQANVAFISANYGAKKVENIKKCILSSMGLVLLLNLVVGGVIMIFHKQLIEIYVQNEEAIEAATQRLKIFVFTYFLCGLMDVMAQSIRGVGYSTSPAIISLIGSCLLRIVYIYTIFKIPQYHNLVSLSFSYPISWLITLAAHITFFLSIRKRAYKKCLEDKSLD